MPTYFVTADGIHLSEWQTPADAKRAAHVVECVMSMGGKLVANIAVRSSTGQHICGRVAAPYAPN